MLQSKREGRLVQLLVTNHSLPINLDHFITGMNLLGSVSRGLQREKQDAYASAGFLPSHNNPHQAKSKVAAIMKTFAENIRTARSHITAVDDLRNANELSL